MTTSMTKYECMMSRKKNSREKNEGFVSMVDGTKQVEILPPCLLKRTLCLGGKDKTSYLHGQAP